MPKLWIVHRNPQSRVSLAQIAGLAASDVVSGAPRESDFAAAPDPAAFVLGGSGIRVAGDWATADPRSPIRGARPATAPSPGDRKVLMSRRRSRMLAGSDP